MLVQQKSLLMVSLAAGLALSASAHAGVRVIHASPDTPPVDVYVNTAPGAGAPAITNLPFRSATGYVPLPTDNYRFRVTPAGATSPVPIDATAAINGSTDYTIAAIGLLSGTPAISPLVLVDDNTINPTQARVRFVHGSPDAPAVDIFAVGLATPVWDAVSFGTSGGYRTLAPGNYNLEVRLDAGGGLALSVPNLQLDAGKVYTVFAVGLVGNGTLAAQPFVDAIPAPGAAGILAGAGLLAFRRRRAK